MRKSADGSLSLAALVDATGLKNVTFLVYCRHMLNVTWERKDLSFNNQGFLSNPSMVIVALDRERLWDKVPPEVTESWLCFYMTF